MQLRQYIDRTIQVNIRHLKMYTQESKNLSNTVFQSKFIGNYFQCKYE